jgi:tRNA dimethylallyltransferase
MNKILVVCGPTATGKTSLAIKLCRKFNGEIVSADSRQVYRGMDIGTGKDIPLNSKFEIRNLKLVGFYKIKNVPLWGYDLVDFKEEFSISKYQKISLKIIENIKNNKKLPVITGGTGFYIKAIIDGLDSVSIPRNIPLRVKLADKSAHELFELLASLDSQKAMSLNESDRKNPRRLIRSIEIANTSGALRKTKNTSGLKDGNEILFIGLTASKEVIDQRIEKRVKQRIKNGFEKEMEKLIDEGFLDSPQAIKTIGYADWLNKVAKDKHKEKFVESWINSEKHYAKRQMTWFKKDKRINWFDVTTSDFEKKIEIFVQKWYDKKDEAGIKTV